MRLRRRSPNEYDGLCLYVTGHVWRVSIGRGTGHDYACLPAGLLFNTSVLIRRLREAGVPVISAVLKDGYCIIERANSRAPIRPDGKRIVGVMNHFYYMYGGNGIRWTWEIPQHS